MMKIVSYNIIWHTGSKPCRNIPSGSVEKEGGAA